MVYNKLVVIEGIDGSGKSTITPIVCESLQKLGIRSTPLIKKDLPLEDSYSELHMRNLKHVIWDEEKPEQDVFGGEHWALLIASWYSVIENRILSKSNGISITDGWFYRNIAKAVEEHKDLDITWLEQLFMRVRKPDLVVLLDIDPSLALKRGRNFDPRECGVRSQYGNVGFVPFQNSVFQRLKKMDKGSEWVTLKIEESQSPSTIAESIVDIVIAKLSVI